MHRKHAPSSSRAQALGYYTLMSEGKPSTRIYADFNGLQHPTVAGGHLAVALDTVGTVQDLSNAGLRLVEGLRFTVWDASDEREDLEGDAVARFDQATGTWWADLGPEGYRYVPAKERYADDRCLCLNCRRDFGAKPRSAAARAEAAPTCPHCGTSRNAAIAPPEA